ncbi:hypothetical protein [Variovorax sp. GB1P17]|uniref:hypothetical protein n=1 Tax=Variovorax sp. GB1P17 TaxID=3443740 RepID=UPI003F46A227
MEMHSFGALAAHFSRLAVIGDAVTHHIVEQAAEVIEKDAKARIGSYQDGIGPFPAWANLAPATIDDRLRKGFTPDDPLERTGGLRGSYSHQATGDTAVVGSPSEIALYMEQGTSKMPPRPVVGPAAMSSRHAVGKVAATTLVAWVCGIGYRKPKISLTDL